MEHGKAKALLGALLLGKAPAEEGEADEKRKKPEGGEEEGQEEEEKEALSEEEVEREAAGEVMSALKAGDAEGFRMALKSFVRCCTGREAGPEEWGEGEG